MISLHCFGENEGVLRAYLLEKVNELFGDVAFQSQLTRAEQAQVFSMLAGFMDQIKENKEDE